MKNSLQFLTTLLVVIFFNTQAFAQVGNADDALPLEGGIDPVLLNAATLKSGYVDASFNLMLLFPGTSAYNTSSNINLIKQRANEVMSQVGISFSSVESSNLGSSDLIEYQSHPFPYQDKWVIILSPDSEFEGDAIGYGNVGQPSLKLKASYFFSISDAKQRTLIGHEMGHNLGITFPENEDIYHSTETSDIMYKYINSQQNYSQYEKQIIHSVATSSAYGRLYDVDRHPINRPTSIYQGDNIALEFYDSAPSNDGYYHKLTNSQGGCTTCGWDSYWNIDVHNNVLRCNGDRVANETLTYGILYKEQPTASSPKFIMGFDFSLGVNKESEVEPEPKPEAPYFSLAFNTFTGSYVASPLQPFTKYRYHMIGSHVPDNAEYLWMYRARVGYNLSLQDATYNIVKGYYTYTGKYAYVTAPADGYYA